MTEEARLSDFLSNEADEECGGSDGDDVSGGDERERNGETAEVDDREGSAESVEDSERAGNGEGVETPDRGEDDANRTNVEPVVSTYAWGEYTCERCGERTQRAWRADGELVCPSCKPW